MDEGGGSRLGANITLLGEAGHLRAMLVGFVIRLMSSDVPL